ncbi:hypothetical protein COLO4_18503 [Corchorus olitorius]|uniref:F-box domain-containing protein n=1 Tax=Corchorus olitorius TaxID=93759 RepID=A0A1R3J8S6_9ROSI|nr:hypothetical protein COLO4_18503 [Corchorus olitorius]
MAHQSQLPEEICMEILERLSVKSLIRFKTVCKSWRSLISTPDFIDRHYDRCAANSNKLGIVVVYANPENLWFPGPDREIYFKTINLSPTSLGEATYVTSQVVTRCEKAKPLGWCRGLLLLGVDCIDFKLLLSNPSTRESKEIPDPPYRRLEYNYISASTLGYDFNIKSHKIVLIYKLGKFEYCIWVYTLKTNSWTCVDLDTDHKYAYYDILPITVANGAPHWVIRHGDVYSNKHGEVYFKGGSTHNAIEYFDFAVNNFKVVPQPGDYDKREFGFNPQLYDTEGSLCIVYRRECGCDLEIWVMETYGVKESWLKWMSFENEYVPFPLCFAKNNINVSLFVARGRGEEGCAIYIGKEKEIELKSLGFDEVSFDGRRRTGLFEFDRCLKKRAFAFDESLICLENDEGGEGNIRRKLNWWELEPGEKSISYFD